MDFHIVLPTPDWSAIIQQIVPFLFGALGTFLTDQLHSVFDGLWGSGANVVGQTDLSIVWSNPAIADQVQSVRSASRAVLIFAVMLLGLRGMLSAVVPARPHMWTEATDGILTTLILVAGFPVVIPEVIGLVNAAAKAVATGAGLATFTAAAGTGQNPFVLLILFVFLIFFGTRLIIKSIWRMGFLAVLLPVGMAAMVLYAVPQLRWIAGWWARIWGGMLIAQLPVVMALAIGVGLVTTGGGIGAFVYSIAFLQLAYDLYDLIPFGMARGSGSPMASAPIRQGIGMLLGGSGAAAVVPAGATTAMSDSQVSQLYGYR